jgi:exosortase A-associated hydrolase 2
LGSVEPRVTPFLLDAAPGRRFGLSFEPTAGTCTGSVLYVHPFAEEMNKSRRMAAQQARELARLGYRVLLIDLYGCGDSDGDFADARWEVWLDDLERASAWLRQSSDERPILWGTRLGATLAMALSARTAHPPAVLHLWQPVVSGEAFLTQFLRMRVASGMIAGERAVGGTKELRALWRAGQSVEVAGYEIAPELARTMDAITVADLGRQDTAVHWYEVVADPNSGAPPATKRTIEALSARGVQVTLHLVGGEPFWATLEITECPQLLQHTASVFAHGR